jgi:signal transduction histidine kinase
LLVLLVAILSSAGLVAGYAYRNLVNSLSWRVNELPLAGELAMHVSEARITLGELRGLQVNTFADTHRDLVPVRVRMVRDQFESQLDEVEHTLNQYSDQLASERQADPRISNHNKEQETVRKIETQLARIRLANRGEDWMLNSVKIGWLDVELERLQKLSIELPSHLHAKLSGFREEVRDKYRTSISAAWTATILAGLVFLLFLLFSYRWIFRPLQTLINGSRRVGSGEFDYRIHLETNDEMAELADALNDMTARFQEIRDDLDRQVRERTTQVVRSEQLASVGFLAAGVAHEINNPLASIAMCAESLESRLRESLDPSDPQQAVVGNYLSMIQKEAFRCKGITERLLDFSRTAPGKRENTDLANVVQEMLELVRHIGKYQRKNVEFQPTEAVVAEVNPQEMKQVVLNLLSNALDSLDDGGAVRIELTTRDGQAVLSVIDNGCGMEPDVLKRIFEPFFTRRRGGQGLGLGLSITHRIVADHGGAMEASSEGPGRGSTFRVRLPLTASQKKDSDHYSRAA